MDIILAWFISGFKNVSPTSKHLSGDGIRTSLSFLQSTRIMPIGLCSKMATACSCSLLYFSSDSEKKTTSK